MIHIFNKYVTRGDWPVDGIALNFRQVHSAYLIATQEKTGLYTIHKNRAAPMPKRPVRRKTLEKYVAMNLAAL